MRCFTAAADRAVEPEKNVSWPLEGRASSAVIFRSVVFPEPLWPTRATHSPAPISSETPRNAMRKRCMRSGHAGGLSPGPDRAAIAPRDRARGHTPRQKLCPPGGAIRCAGAPLQVQEYAPAQALVRSALPALRAAPCSSSVQVRLASPGRLRLPELA